MATVYERAAWSRWTLRLRSPPAARAFRHSQRGQRRVYSSSENSLPTKSPTASGTTSSSPASAKHAQSGADATSRFARVNTRLPRFLQKYTARLRSAPASHVASFLILHEITAVIPLFGFGWAFYRMNSLPWWAEGVWFDDGVRKFGRYFRRKGWLGKEEQEQLDRLEAEHEQDGHGGKGHAQKQFKGQDTVVTGEGDNSDQVKTRKWWTLPAPADGRARRAVWWGRGENTVHLVTSFAAAYALTKLLLPVRLAFSLWATPAFARIAVVPITSRIGGVFKRLVGGKSGPKKGT